MQVIIDQILSFNNQVSVNSSVILTVLGVLFAVSKMISTEKAGPLVSRVQRGFDLLAKLLVNLGAIVQKFADALAQVLQSDGILGKK